MKSTPPLPLTPFRKHTSLLQELGGCTQHLLNHDYQDPNSGMLLHSDNLYNPLQTSDNQTSNK
jgi:hypothetical protein